MPVVVTGEKAFDASVLDHSVQRSDAPRAPIGPDTGYILWISHLAETIIPWGTNPKGRDLQLRTFFPTEGYFLSALGSVCSRNAGFGWSLEGGAKSVEAMQRMLHSANFGAGWIDFIVRYSIDLYTQDHGAFVELIRPEVRDTAPIIGISTLDAMRCFPTGDPETPVIYQDDVNRFHELKWFQVSQRTEMPSPAIRAAAGGGYTLQYCALSRMLRQVQILKNMSIYQDEKLSGKFQRAIHLVKGVDVRKIEDAVAKASVQSDNAGMTRYTQPAIIGGPNPTADVGHDTIELASLPDSFKFEEMLKWYLTIVAMAFNTDYQEFAPLPGGNLGTSGQSEVLHMKNRGKGPALFQKSVTHFLNTLVLPDNVTFLFDEQDREEDKAVADIRKTRSEARAADITSGVLDVPAARQQMLDDGDITREVFDAMGERDLEAEERAEDDRRFQPDPPPLDDDQADAASAKRGPQPAAQAGDLTPTLGAGAKEADRLGEREAVPPGRQDVEDDVEDEVDVMLKGVHRRIRDRIREISREKEMTARATRPASARQVVERRSVVRDGAGRIDQVVIVRDEAAS